MLVGLTINADKEKVTTSGNKEWGQIYDQKGQCSMVGLALDLMINNNV